MKEKAKQLSKEKYENKNISKNKSKSTDVKQFYWMMTLNKMSSNEAKIIMIQWVRILNCSCKQRLRDTELVLIVNKFYWMKKNCSKRGKIMWCLFSSTLHSKICITARYVHIHGNYCESHCKRKQSCASKLWIFSQLQKQSVFRGIVPELYLNKVL